MSNTQEQHFVDRHEAVAFFKYLCNIKTTSGSSASELSIEQLEESIDFSQPFDEESTRKLEQLRSTLPILTFLAPEGSGKSTLIKHLQDTVCRQNGEVVLPYAHLDFTHSDAPKGLLSILIAIRNQLQHLQDRHGKRLAFPRFDLGAAIVSIAPIGISRSYGENEPGEEVVQRVINRLKHDHEMDIVLEWYRSRHSLRAEENETVATLRTLCEPGNPTRQQFLEETLPAALLTDLRYALGVDHQHHAAPRAWQRTTNVVLFLDGFEVLLRQGRNSPGIRLLQALTGYGRSEANPVLLVLGSSERLFIVENPHPSSPFEQTTIERDQLAIEEYVQERYESWRGHLPTDRRYISLRDLYLPFWLDSFGLEDTRRFLQQFRGEMFTDEAWVQAIHRVTGGHALALKLAATALLDVQAHGQQLSISEFLSGFGEMRVSSRVVADRSDETVNEYLLAVFLAQVPRSQWNNLTFAAMLRSIDVESLRVVTQVHSDIEAERLLDYYRHLTFVRILDEERIAIAPAVRTLLLQTLLPGLDPQSDYYRRYKALQEHFQRRAIKGDRRARAEEVYYALAIGDAQPAIEYALLVQQEDVREWQHLQNLIAEAPTALIPENTKTRAHDALDRATLAQVRSRRIPPETIRRDATTAIVLYLWLLAASGRDAYENTYLLRKLGEVYLLLADVSQAGQQVYQAAAAGYLGKAAEIHEEIARSESDLGVVTLAQTGSILEDVDFADVDVEEIERPSGPLLPPRRRRRRRFRDLLIPLLLLLLLLSGFLLVIVIFVPVPGPTSPTPHPPPVVPPTPECGLPVVTPAHSAPGIGTTLTANGQTIGISDGSSVFDTASDSFTKGEAANQLRAGNTAAATSFWQQAVANYANDAEGQIYAEDANVLATHQPYITFIVGTSFTPNSVIGRDNLQGAFVAQREHNRLGKFPLAGNTLVRLLIANFGDDPNCAAMVANQIVQAEKADPTIVGVLGWPSISRTIDAIQILTNAHIPIIAPNEASDTLTGLSPYVFRIAPSNKNEGIAGANYARQVLKVKNVALFVDPTDAYSSSLAQDFKQQFTNNGTDPAHTIVAVEKYTVGKADQQTMSRLLNDALNAFPQPDLIYFAGSSRDADPLLAELPTSGPEGTLRVMGGNGLYLAGGFGINSRANYQRLYFTAASYPDEWEVLGKAAHKPAFFADYARFFDPNNVYGKGAYGYQRTNSNVMLEYDAMQVFLKGANIVGKSQFTSTELQQAIPQITGAQKVQGVTGQITIGPDGNSVDKAVLMLVVNQNKNIVMVNKVLLGTF